MKWRYLFEAIGFASFIACLLLIVFGSVIFGGVAEMNRECNAQGGIVVRTPTNFTCIRVPVISHT